MNKLTLLLTLFLSFGFLDEYNGYSQCGNKLKLVVVDHHDEEPLAFATVFIQEEKRSYMTDENGHIDIDSLCNGGFHLIIAHIGCPSLTRFIQISEPTTTIKIYMEHHDELLEEVVITAIENGGSTGKNKSSINRDQMMMMSAQSLAEIAATIPGVSTIKTGSGIAKPIINGLMANRISIVNQGIPLESQQWGLDHSPEIDPYSMDKISVIKGPGAVKYGMQAIGGVIIVDNDMPSDPHWHGDVRVNSYTNGRGILAASTFKKAYQKFAVRSSATFSTGGDRSTPSYYLTNTGSKQGSFSIQASSITPSRYQFKLGYTYFVNKTGILRGSHLGNLTDLTEAIGRDVPFYTDEKFSYDINNPYQVVNHHTLTIKQQYKRNEKIHINLITAIQNNSRLEYDVRRVSAGNRPSLSLNLFHIFNDINLEYNIGKSMLECGLQHKFGFNVNDPLTGISPLIPDYSSYTSSIYSIYKYKHSNSLFLEVGGRLEKRKYDVGRIVQQSLVTSSHTFLNQSLNLGIRKTITNMTIYGDVSITSRPPDISEMYSNGLHQGVSGIELGDPQLPIERLIRGSLEFSGHIWSGTFITASNYISRFKDFIYLRPTNENRLTIRGAFPVFSYTHIPALIWGNSIRIIQNLNNFFQLTFSSEYTHGTNLTTRKGIIRIPPWSGKAGIQYNKSLTKIAKEITVGTEYSYSARQNHVDIDEDFLPPPRDFIIQNLWIEALIHHQSGHDVKISIRCDNIWNTTYRDYLNRWRYFANEIGRNITLNIYKKF